MRIAYLDCPSGISGDMTLGALVDAGVPLDALNAAVSSLGLPGVKLVAQEVKKHGFRATQITVEHEPEHKHRHLHHIEAIIDQSQTYLEAKGDCPGHLPAIGRGRSQSSRLDHRESPLSRGWRGRFDRGHCRRGRRLGPARAVRLVVSPIPTGIGRITIAHGDCSIPAPATAELLRGIPLAASSVEAELTTPTGAAIVAALAEEFGPMPAMTIQHIGYGAGQRDLAQQANILRLLVGEMAETASASDSIVILETNLDDVSGEVIGHCIGKLWDAGALDVYTTAIQMKKHRPGVKLSVLCRANMSRLWKRSSFARPARWASAAGLPRVISAARKLQG